GEALVDLFRRHGQQRRAAERLLDRRRRDAPRLAEEVALAHLAGAEVRRLVGDDQAAARRSVAGLRAGLLARPVRPARPSRAAPPPRSRPRRPARAGGAPPPGAPRGVGAGGPPPPAPGAPPPPPPAGSPPPAGAASPRGGGDPPAPAPSGAPAASGTCSVDGWA